MSRLWRVGIMDSPSTPMMRPTKVKIRMSPTRAMTSAWSQK